MDNIIKHNFRKGKVSKEELKVLFNEILSEIKENDLIDVVNINILRDGQVENTFYYDKYIELLGLIEMTKEALTIEQVNLYYED